MAEFAELPNHPGLQFKPVVSTEFRSLKTAPTEISRLTDLSHLERHFDGRELGSPFVPNESFRSAKDLAELLEQIGRELIKPGEFNKSHILMISFPHTIGKEGVVAIEPKDEIEVQTRDAGQPDESDVNVVKRTTTEGLNYLTVEFRPVFPKKGTTGEAVKFQLWSAFPGDPTPRRITKNREKSFALNPGKDPSFRNDKEFWDKHAFVVLSE